MTGSRPIPPRKSVAARLSQSPAASRLSQSATTHRESIVELASSLAASFADPAPIAQEALARDIAEISEQGDEDEEAVREGDEDVDREPEAVSHMYRRPSGIAFGTARPAMANGPIEETGLSKIEKKQSRDAEASLLRDNHLLPPKHGVQQEPGLLKKVYKNIFSTKLPISDADADDPARPTPEAAETTPLLQPSAEATANIDEQFEAAVAAGQIRTTWQREAKTITSYSLPLIATFLMQYSISITSIFAVGRIGKLELGAVTLATMTGNISFWAPAQGLATCLDTLCSQAFGSGHKTLVGLQVQRMALFLLIVTVPIAVVWWRSVDILAALIPERQSAELAGSYLRVLIIGMPPFVFFECGKRFVQAQGLFSANTYVLAVAAPVNIVLMWLLVWKFEYGFIGAPIAVVTTQWFEVTLLLLYVIFVNGSQCWGGFSRRVFSNWGPMIRLALPGMIMVEAEYFAFEILTLAAGRLGTASLAAQSILVTITSTTYQIPFPMSIAASTRVANLIGAKLPDAAKICARVAIIGGFLIGIFNVVLVASLRYEIPLLLTDDEEVINIVARAMPIVAGLQLLDGLCAVSHGLLRGIGRQEIGGYVNLFMYYVIALPISIGAGFGLGWHLAGLWFGVTLGLFLVSCVEYLFLYQYDWSKAVVEAERRNAAG